MPFPSDTYLHFIRSAGNWVADEFQELYAQMTGWLSSEHKDDGSHGNVTADNVTLRQDGAVAYTPLTAGVASADIRLVEFDETTDSGAQTREALLLKNYQGNDGGPIVFRMPTRTNLADYAEVALGVSTTGPLGPEHQFGDATAIKALRLFPQSAYAASANDTSALFESSQNSPQYSFYRITSGSNIEGIYSSGFATAGQRGQVVVLYNGTGGTLSFKNLAAVSNQNKILGSAFTIQDKGSAMFVYNQNDQGWAPVGMTPVLGAWADFTPTWSSASDPQPAIGNGTITGRYTVIGNVCHFRIRFTPGSTTTFGTGAWSFTLPTTAASVQPDVAGSCRVFDAGTANYVAVTFLQTTTTFSFVSNAVGNSFTSLLPMTWTNGDYADGGGTFEVA